MNEVKPQILSVSIFSYVFVVASRESPTVGCSCVAKPPSVRGVRGCGKPDNSLRDSQLRINTFSAMSGRATCWNANLRSLQCQAVQRLCSNKGRAIHHDVDVQVARLSLRRNGRSPSITAGIPHVSLRSRTWTNMLSGSTGWVAGELPPSSYVMLARVSNEPPTLPQSQASTTYVISRSNSSRFAIFHHSVNPSYGQGKAWSACFLRIKTSIRERF